MALVPKVELINMNLGGIESLPDELKLPVESIILTSLTFATLREQVYYLRKTRVSKGENGFQLSFEQSASILKKSKGTVFDHYKKAIRDNQGQKLSNKRPRLLTQNELNNIYDFVVVNYYQGNYFTYAQLAEYLFINTGKRLTGEQLGAIIRNDFRFKTVRAIPLEAERVKCPKEEINLYFDNIKHALDGVPAALIGNLDEMGYADSTDTREICVVVPADHDGKDVVLPFERVNNHITFIETIFADGTRLKPAIIIRRKNIEQEVYENGLTPEKLTLYYQENGFMNTPIFQDYCMNSLFPEILARLHFYRKHMNQPQLRFHLLIDGMRAHFSEELDEFCFSHGIEIHVPPSHSSDQVQALDLCVFSAAKAHAPRTNALKSQNKQTKIIDKVFKAMQMASTTHNIIKSFKRAGIITRWDTDAQCLRALVDIRFCDRVRHFHVTKIPESDPIYSNSTKRIPITRDLVLINDPFFDYECQFEEDDSELQIIPKKLIPLGCEISSCLTNILNEIFPNGTDLLIGEYNPQRRNGYREKYASDEITDTLSVGNQSNTNPSETNSVQIYGSGHYSAQWTATISRSSFPENSQLSNSTFSSNFSSLPSFNLSNELYSACALAGEKLPQRKIRKLINSIFYQIYHQNNDVTPNSLK